MTKTFEELLEGRKLHELTDQEIDEIVTQMSPVELDKLNQAIKKETKKKTRAPGKKQQKNLDDFNKALFGNDK